MLEEDISGRCKFCKCKMYINSFGKSISVDPAPDCLCEMEVEWEESFEDLQYNLKKEVMKLTNIPKAQLTSIRGGKYANIRQKY